MVAAQQKIKDIFQTMVTFSLTYWKTVLKNKCYKSLPWNKRQGHLPNQFWNIRFHFSSKIRALHFIGFLYQTLRDPLHFWRKQNTLVAWSGGLWEDATLGFSPVYNSQGKFYLVSGPQFPQINTKNTEHNDWVSSICS